MSNPEMGAEFALALSAIPRCWHRELRFAWIWADLISVEWDDHEEPTGCIVFTKAGEAFTFLIGDDCWDVDDPRGAMLEVLFDALVEARSLMAVPERNQDERDYIDRCGALEALIVEAT